MKNKTSQQEILLNITTTLSKKQFYKKNSDHYSSKNLSPIDQLEEACWNGLLDEMLPEILNKRTAHKRLFLWHIRQGKNSLQIDLSEFPLSMEKQFSIDTHLFLSSMIKN